MSSTLFFGNVSFDSTVESIQAFIAHYGIQGQVELPRSRAGSRRRNGGFALVTVPAESSEAAIATLHDKECDGRRVTVKISRESGGLGGQRSAERGTSAAAPAPRTRAPREPRAPRENVGGFSAGGAARAPRAPREPRADRPPRAERAPRPVELSRSAGPGQKTLFLGNLAFASTVESVAAFIAANGVQVNATDIELPASSNGRSRGFALVYVSEGALAAGIAALNDKECDGRVLRVTEARESGGLGGSRSAERA